MAEINKNLMRVLQVNQQVKAVTPNCETYGGPHSYTDYPATIGQTQNIYAVRAYQGNSYQPQGNRNLISYRSDNYLGLPGFNQNQNRNNQNHNFHNQNRNQGNNHGIPQGNNQGRNQFFQGASHGQNPPPAYQAQAYQAQAYQALGYQALVHQPPIPQPQVVTTNEFTNYMKANDLILKNMQTNMTSLTNSNLKLKNMFGQFMKINTASSLGSGTLPSNTITNPKEDLKGITTQSGTAYQGPRIPTTSSSPPVVERETEVTKDTMHPTNNGSTKDVQPTVVQTEILTLNSEPVVAPIIEPVVAPISALKPTQKPSILYLSKLHDQKLHKLSELARTLLNEHCSTVLLKKLPEKLGDRGDDKLPVIIDNDLSNEEKTALIKVLKSHKRAIAWKLFNIKVNAFLALEDDPTLPEVDHSYYNTEGDILFLEAFLNDDPSLPPPTQGKYLPQIRNELKICEAKNDKSLIDEPPEVELKDLPPHLEYAFLEGDNKLPVIIAKDLSVEEKAALVKVLKSHKQAITLKFFDIKGINLKFCTQKILMEDDFKPAVQHQRRVNPKIHDVIKKEVEKLLDAGLIYPISDSPWVSPLHFVPKKGGYTVVENEENELIPTRLVTGWRRLSRNEYYYFLDGFSGYFQIPIDPKDQEKTTFMCPYGTKTMEDFMVDFSVFGNSFETCLSHLEKMLKQCEDTNLCINWEKSHFMVKEGIVLGHKISMNGIEVDKAKVDVIAKLPHPTTVKVIHTFLGHAEFYRQFIQDFSKIARLMTRLLKKDTPFFFSKECVEAFQTLMRKLTEAPILIAPDWDLPFKLMCDASDFAIGVVLGQHHEKHFRPIHYASKTITKAESYYTMTAKEMLAVVY
nr:reverse transcriptase domain-containing protein [Tanacetum cinerariifolium]